MVSKLWPAPPRSLSIHLSKSPLIKAIFETIWPEGVIVRELHTFLNFDPTLAAKEHLSNLILPHLRVGVNFETICFKVCLASVSSFRNRHIGTNTMNAAKRSDNLSQAGQNLIRVIIASYFIGVSIGLINGTDATPLAAMFLEPELAALIGSATIFIFGYLVMTGIWLRFAALMLALIMFWSSYISNFSATDVDGIGNFWRDMTLIGALMLTYVRTGRGDVRKRAMIRRKPKVRQFNSATKITPRRVAVSVASNVTRLPRSKVRDVRPVSKAEIANIFAEEDVRILSR